MGYIDVDEKGRRLSIKLMIRIKKPMSDEGYKRWGHLQRRHISKSRYVWKHYASSSNDLYMFFPDGRVPISHLETDHAIGNFILDFFSVEDGMTLSLQGWMFKKGCRKSICLTPHLCEIKILSVENRKVNVTKTRRLDYYWFRREAKKKKLGMWS